MKRLLSRVLNVFVSLAMLAILFLGTVGESRAEIPAAPKNASAAASGDDVISARMTAPNWTAATEPWTKEQMLAAKPYPMPTLDGEAQMSLSAEAPTGAPGNSPSGKPSTGGNLTLLNAGDEAAVSFGTPLGYSYPAPFTRYPNFDSYKVFPYITVGKLFFTQYGTNYVCSASSIGNYAIWTAGHCVHAGNGLSSGWSYNVIFVPAYKNGNAPLGVWSYSNLWTTNHWYYNGSTCSTCLDPRRDMGGAVLYTLGGYKISQKVGWLGFAYNQSRNLSWYLMGYPQASPFNGLQQQICASSFAYVDTNMGTPYPTGVGCDQTGGTSGGPWIWRFSGSAGPKNYLNGDNSYRYNNHPNELFTPYFDDAAYSLWSALRTDTP